MGIYLINYELLLYHSFSFSYLKKLLLTSDKTVNMLIKNIKKKLFICLMNYIIIYFTKKLK